jgi:FkbM family methyltransferase
LLNALLRKAAESALYILPWKLRARIVGIALGFLDEFAYWKIKSTGFVPSMIVDIGAYKGNWSLSVARLFPGVPVMMIEPQPDKSERLMDVAKKIGGSFRPILLGAEEGKELTFWVMGTGSSIYPENSNAKREPLKLITRTLDSVFEEEGIAAKPIFLKIDAQGSELDILRGASRVLRSAEIVQLEVALVEYNAGGPPISQVLDFMTSAGFSIFEIAGVGRPTGLELVQIDFVFIKSDSKFRKSEFQFSA